MDPTSAPVGVFDSGIGGLTVLRALLAELPHERFTYLGDTARLPYGTKSGETVVRYSLHAAEALLDLGVKCLVVACNTASSVGLQAIRELVGPLPVIGVIEPGAEAACRASRSGHIAVMATERTVSGGAYQQAILRRRPDARVDALAAQLLVALAEEGLSEGPIAESVVRHYLGALFERGGAEPGAGRGAAEGASIPDTVVLGCTHFPALAPAIRAVVGPRVRIVDSAETTARAVREELSALGIACASGASEVQYIATDGTERFARIGSRFLGQAILPDEVQLIDL
ncbi:MAG: glutamate racemase [Steroidobacteraceae bacterium]